MQAGRGTHVPRLFSCRMQARGRGGEMPQRPLRYNSRTPAPHPPMPTTLPADPRVESLIQRMTLEEKAGQLGVFADMVRPFAPDVNPETNVRNAAEVLEQV